MSISVKTFTFSLRGFVGGADEMNIIMEYYHGKCYRLNSIHSELHVASNEAIQKCEFQLPMLQQLFYYYYESRTITYIRRSNTSIHEQLKKKHSSYFN